MKFFPREGPLPSAPQTQSSVSSVGPLNNLIAFFRFIFYRPIRQIVVKKGWRPIVFPSLSVIVIVALALLLGILYCTLPQPLFWDSISFGSPPLAIRSGMMAVALLPWIVALATKANLISMVTGISHERLNVLHRWAAYICLILSILHTVPFYVTPIWEKGAQQAFQQLFKQQQGVYIYGTGTYYSSTLCRSSSRGFVLTCLQELRLSFPCASSVCTPSHPYVTECTSCLSRSTCPSPSSSSE